MNKPSFEWDESKNSINKQKHKISFEEAKTVFLDYDALYMPDPEHSESEERFIILGMSTKANLLIVCHCYRQSESVIRIIMRRELWKLQEQTSSYEVTPTELAGILMGRKML